MSEVRNEYSMYVESRYQFQLSLLNSNNNSTIILPVEEKLMEDGLYKMLNTIEDTNSLLGMNNLLSSLWIVFTQVKRHYGHCSLTRDLLDAYYTKLGDLKRKRGKKNDDE